MLAYEIHVAGTGAEEGAERVRLALEAACGESVDRALPLTDARVRALLLPTGVEWSFERLRQVVGELRVVARECSVSLAGMPEDDDELVAALLRQAALLDAHGHASRAAALRREAEQVVGDGTATSDGDSMTTPSDGDSMTTPSDGDSMTTPSDGDSMTTPSDGDSMTTPSDGE